MLGVFGSNTMPARSHVSSDKRRYGIMPHDGRAMAAVLGVETTVTLRRIDRDVQAQSPIGVSRSIGENAI
jgi:hypothetical protein